MAQELVRKVAVSLTVIVDYDELWIGSGVNKAEPKSWSPAIELARMVSTIQGVHEVVSVNNLTVQNTGKDYEIDDPEGDKLVPRDAEQG
jgi:hypothetical protein